MKMIKRRIAIFLCMLMAFTTVAAFAPVAQDSVQAKTKWIYSLWANYTFNEETTKLSEANDFLVVEKGVKGFSISDLVYGYALSEDGEEIA